MIRSLASMILLVSTDFRSNGGLSKIPAITCCWRNAGVSWYKGAYRARMIADGKDRFLGTFDSKEDAAKAVDR